MRMWAIIPYLLIDFGEASLWRRTRDTPVGLKGFARF